MFMIARRSLCKAIENRLNRISWQVMLALIPVRAPLSKMAHTALLELQHARDLYEQAAPYGGRAVKMAVSHKGLAFRRRRPRLQ